MASSEPVSIPALQRAGTYKQSRHPPLDDVKSTGSSTCPVKAMHKFLVSWRLYSHGPLFTFSSGDLLTRSAISTTTTSLLIAAGIDAGAYSSHSYRIGAATAAAEAGLPHHLIKSLGRCEALPTTAYQGYIRTSPEVLLKAAKTNYPGPVRYAVLRYRM